jgi:hypothetical protein
MTPADYLTAGAVCPVSYAQTEFATGLMSEPRRCEDPANDADAQYWKTCRSWQAMAGAAAYAGLMQTQKPVVFRN